MKKSTEDSKCVVCKGTTKKEKKVKYQMGRMNLGYMNHKNDPLFSGFMLSFATI